MNKKPTIRDIAEICGCSANTVSRVLRGSTRISLALREKIARVAKEIGYIPNSLAESMRTGSTKTIAVIFQDFRNPFFGILPEHCGSNVHPITAKIGIHGISVYFLKAGFHPRQ